MKHKGDGDTNCNWCTWNNPQKLVPEAERFRNQRTSGVHANSSERTSVIADVKNSQRVIWLYETINYIISKCIKMTRKKYNTMQTLVEKENHNDKYL